MIAEKHLIFYKASEKDNTVTVYAIVYGVKRVVSRCTPHVRNVQEDEEQLYKNRKP